jgi:hypothetical protein
MAHSLQQWRMLHACCLQWHLLGSWNSRVWVHTHTHSAHPRHCTSAAPLQTHLEGAVVPEVHQRIGKAQEYRRDDEVVVRVADALRGTAACMGTRAVPASAAAAAGGGGGSLSDAPVASTRPRQPRPLLSCSPSKGGRSLTACPPARHPGLRRAHPTHSTPGAARLRPCKIRGEVRGMD